MKILEIEQNSPEWRVWRKVGIGSSDAPSIMNVSIYRTKDQLKLMKLGQLKSKDNGATRRGHDLEPVARDLYHFLRGIHTRPVCVVHDHYDWLKASLDGLSDDNKRMLEIKCIKKEFHAMALEGKVPPMYFPQVQHDFLVSELKDLDYWSYSESSFFSKAQKVALVRVTPDQTYIQDLFEREKDFCREIGIKVD